MPEIWLNYGRNEVVLDIMAENLDEQIKFEQPVIDDSTINENLEGLDFSKPTEIVIQNYSISVQKISWVKFTKSVTSNHFQNLNC